MKSPTDTIRAGDRRAAARLISRLESYDPGALEVLSQLSSGHVRAHLVGFTGPPGVGKSTLLNSLVKYIRERGETIGVISFDPVSPFTGGALLGDRIRMQQHATDSGVYIRSVPVRRNLIDAAAAVELIVPVMDAMGFKYIMIETVGVGQSEPEVADLADTMVVLEAPGLGDEIQMMKTGLSETGDIFVLNKKDLPGADQAMARWHANHNRKTGDGSWTCPLIITSAVTGDGIDELCQAIQKHLTYLTEENRLQPNRTKKRTNRLRRLLSFRVSRWVKHRLENDDSLSELLRTAAKGNEDMTAAINRIMTQLGLD